jgi:hypothetical protein
LRGDATLALFSRGRLPSVVNEGSSCCWTRPDSCAVLARAMRAYAVFLVLATCAAAGWFVRHGWLERLPPRLRGSTSAHTLVGAAAHEAQTPELAAAAVRRSLQAAAQRATWRPPSLQAAAKPETWPPPPSQLAATVAESIAASVLPTLRLRLRQQAAAGSFGGNQTADDRTRLHAGCLGETKCGYLAPSGFDRLREEVRRHEAARPCPIVVLTAIFGCKDKLQQPEAPPPQLHACFFAFVDEQSDSYLRATVRPRLPPPFTHQCTLPPHARPPACLGGRRRATSR